ncbi:hypothetical protein ACFL04_02040 [Patescibacteria group bacterium]
MNLLRRSLPIISSLLLILTTQVLLFYPNLIWYLGGLYLLISIFTSIVVSRGDVRGGRWHFAIMAALYALSVILFLLFLQANIFKQLHLISTAALWWLWMEQLYRFNYDPQKYIPFAVANIASMVAVVTSFYFASSSFALKLLLGYPTWILTLIAGLLGFLFSIEIIWSEKLSPIRYWRVPVVIGLITAELFWSIHYLPSSYLVNGLILTIIMYISINLGRFSINQQLTATVLKRYLLIGTIMLLLTVVSARWI